MLAKIVLYTAFNFILIKFWGSNHFFFNIIATKSFDFPVLYFGNENQNFYY